jgi:hypothetical protein
MAVHAASVVVARMMVLGMRLVKATQVFVAGAIRPARPYDFTWLTCTALLEEYADKP